MSDFRNPRQWKENDKKQFLSLSCPSGFEFLLSVLSALPQEEEKVIVRKSE